jgi:hypothetical protein
VLVLGREFPLGMRGTERAAASFSSSGTSGRISDPVSSHARLGQAGRRRRTSLPSSDQWLLNLVLLKTSRRYSLTSSYRGV